MSDNKKFIFILWLFLWIPIFGNIGNKGTQYNFIWCSWLLIFITVIFIGYVLPYTKLGLKV